jgi:ribosomal protein L40E
MQEHAEGTRSQKPVICLECGAANDARAKACAKCNAPLPGPVEGVREMLKKD